MRKVVTDPNHAARRIKALMEARPVYNGVSFRLASINYVERKYSGDSFQALATKNMDDLLIESAIYWVSMDGRRTVRWDPIVLEPNYGPQTVIGFDPIQT